MFAIVTSNSILLFKQKEFMVIEKAFDCPFLRTFIKCLAKWIVKSRESASGLIQPSEQYITLFPPILLQFWLNLFVQNGHWEWRRLLVLEVCYLQPLLPKLQKGFVLSLFGC